MNDIMNPWTHHGEIFEYKQEPMLVSKIDRTKFWQGFVYLITNHVNGKAYIGKKFFWTPTKKSLVRGGKKKKYLVESDWRTYCGSSDVLKEAIAKDGILNFT